MSDQNQNCPDICHIWSENVRCPTVISGSVHTTSNKFLKITQLQCMHVQARDYIKINEYLIEKCRFYWDNFFD